MPKKHQPSFLKLSNAHNPSSSSSSSGSAAAGSSSSAEARTVNERLAQLRREQAPRPTQEQRNQITDAVTQRTVHPAVRRLLNLPDAVAPRPRPGTLAARLHAGAGGRRISGPPAPRSWLETSIHALPEQRLSRTNETESDGESWGVARYSSLARLEDSPLALPDQRSLIHLTLKGLAINWEYLVEFEQHYLPTLPVWLKGLLLTYLSTYGPRNGLTISRMKMLFMEASEDLDASGGQELSQLDIGALLNEKFTLPDLNRYLNAKPVPDVSDTLRDLKISPHVAENVPLLDSWEVEADAPKLSAPLSTSRFPNLTRLSLANAGEQASWGHFLRLSKHLSKVTHLSLAYWPTPSLTPNALTAEMVTNHVRVSLGGTNLYSGYDGDWQESASLLRRLSKNMYSLRWLDLEGCKWHAALTWGVELSSLQHLETRQVETRTVGHLHMEDDAPGSANEHSRSPSPRENSLNWQHNVTASGPDWNGSWRHVEQLNLSQGWIPLDMSAIRRLPGSLVGLELLGYLRERQAAGDLPAADCSGTTDRDLRYWMVAEKESRRVGSTIRALRSAAGGAYCSVDHGWSAPKGTRMAAAATDGAD